MTDDVSLGQIVGAIAGFVVGGPQGAYYGYQIGTAIDPPDGPTIQGPRLEDLSGQTASYGVRLPRIYGTDVVHGNVFWLENNQLKEVKRKEKQGGKGGGGGTVETYSYYATFAVSLCDNEIADVIRTWVASDLISNPSSTDFDTTLATSSFRGVIGRLLATVEAAKSGSFKVYFGTDSQLPDERMEADLGVGNCPAYRGLAYIVFYDWPLEKFGNSLMGAQVKCEVTGSVTSGALYSMGSTIVDGVVSGNPPMCWYAQKDHAIVYRPDGEVINNDPVTVMRVTPTSSVPLYSAIMDTSAGFTRFDPGGTDDPDLRLWDLPADWNSTFTGRTSVKVYAGVAYEADVSGAVISYPWIVNNYGGSGVTLPDYELNITGDGTYAYVLVRNTASVREFAVRKYDAAWVLQDDSGWLTNPVDIVVQMEHDIDIDGSAVWVGIFNRYFYALDISNLSDTSAHFYAGDAGDQTLLGLAEARSFQVFDGICCRRTFSNTQLWIEWIFLPGSTSSGSANLSDIVRGEMLRSELIEDADIDVTLLTDTVRGYKLAGVAPIRSGIEPLQQAYSFDIIGSGYQIKCVPRGQSSIKTISSDDLILNSDSKIVDRQRIEDSQLPRKIIYRYIDIDREHDPSEQESLERVASGAVNVAEIEGPVVFTADEAAGVADVIQYRKWLERDSFAIKLPPSHIDLEPTDVITLMLPYATFELIILGVSYSAGGQLDIQATLNDSAVYTPNAAGGQGSLTDGLIGYAGDSNIELLDIPLIRDIDDSAGFAAALSGNSSGWLGGTIIRSNDNEQTWSTVEAFTSPVVMGRALDVLPQDDGFVIDRASVLGVQLLSSDMSLDSITEAQLLAGMHWCAYGLDGRWELIRFANATLNADGSYTLDTLIRGCRGTEQYTGTHELYDSFVFLDDIDLGLVGMDIGDVGIERFWRGISSGQDIEDVASRAFTYRASNLRPLSPIYAASSYRGADDIRLEWVRRSRLGTSWWLTGVSRPLGESTEAWEVDVLDGANVVRTLVSSESFLTYTNAQQVTDFGATQTTLTVDIYQMSDRVGRGYPLNATVAPAYLSWPSFETKVYTGLGLSVTAQEAKPRGIALNGNEDTIYIVGDNQTVYQYKMTDSADVSSGIYSGSSGSLAATLGGNAQGMAISPDESKLFIIAVNKIYQFSLTTPGDVTTVSYDSKFIQPNQNTQGVAFNDAGTYMIVLTNADNRIVEYTLATAWDISTASVGGFYPTGPDSVVSASDVKLSPDGFSFVVTTTSVQYQYKLSVAYDVTTAVLFTQFATQNGTGGTVNVEGSRFYWINNSDIILQYE